MVQGVAVAFEYMQWLQNERRVNVRTIGITIRSIMSAAKFLYHDVSVSTLRWRSTIIVASRVSPQLKCCDWPLQTWHPELQPSLRLPECCTVMQTSRPGEGDRPYSDLEVVRELRAMANTAKREGQRCRSFWQLQGSYCCRYVVAA